MDAALIKNWNETVPPDGIVYHLGDVGLCSTGRLKEILWALNGNIFLCLGNHDQTATDRTCFKRFDSITDVRTVKIEGQAIFLSHYAHRVWNKSHHGRWHLYGHSHGSLPDLPESLSFDVGVDCTNFKPLTFFEVEERMKLKTWKPVDHHV